MASMSGSEQESEEPWDDMAIVRAFEEALTDQRTRASAAPKKNGRKQKPAARSNGRKAARSVSVEEEEEEEELEPTEAAATPTTGAVWGQNAAQPNAGAYGPFPAGASSFAQQQQPNDTYQAAYAQAYAHLQAQFQAAYPAGPQAAQHFAAAPQPYNAQMPAFPAQPPYYSPSGPTPTVPSMQMPFPAIPGVAPFPGSVPNASDDGLANLLLSWYQSGYYTGRFQAMQEMKMRGHR